MPEELKKCPFCNGDAKLTEDNTIMGYPAFRVRCKNINCAIRPKTNWFNDKNDAIKKWNKRY